MEKLQTLFFGIVLIAGVGACAKEVHLSSAGNERVIFYGDHGHVALDLALEKIDGGREALASWVQGSKSGSISPTSWVPRIYVISDKWSVNFMPEQTVLNVQLGSNSRRRSQFVWPRTKRDQRFVSFLKECRRAMEQ